MTTARDKVPVVRTRSGSPYSLGADWDGAGVNFAVFSENATRVGLCLFGETGGRETARIPVAEVRHVYLPEARPGLGYGYRVHMGRRPTGAGGWRG